ncbi:TPA: hypothetical protein MCG72_000691 [Klebsiella pneumoniae]|nr:hypothetical protein [Klebsiella pneumoniae]HBT7050118.1 hypothetical protein [Klebsiella pneumoniae]
MNEFSREALLNIIETDHVQCGEASALARMALAAMDSEPVAWTWHYREKWHVTNDEERARDLAWDGVKVEPLYRHAQQPVVPDAYVRDERGRMMLNGICEPKIGFGAGWNACRAAMLQAQSDDDGEPTDDERIMAIEGIHNCERCSDEGWVVGEMGITRCACGQAGNSPAQSDCCPAQNSVAPAQSPIDHGYRPGCECSGCKATARICADLSANSPANPGCWCRTCRPVVLNDMRFVVCPDCGNKRCPRANDHRNACTGSNEPGQEGSAYPADPQEVKSE